MFPELHTDRFLLKQIVASDQAFIFKGLSHPEVIPFYGVQYKTIDEAKKQMDFYDDLWREKKGIWWKITDRASGSPVGACGINSYQAVHEKAEIGYWLLPEFWRKKIMSEVLPVVISYVFRHWNLNRLEAVIEEGNETSWRLAEKLGFKYEGKLREAEIKNGKRINLLMYSLLATERK
ncbi:MAG TPA: GNAT family protein [Chitinophagaceae bacterium]|nr:GNAT family protein [Chitinophagaceae bacterium]